MIKKFEEFVNIDNSENIEVNEVSAALADKAAEISYKKARE